MTPGVYKIRFTDGKENTPWLKTYHCATLLGLERKWNFIGLGAAALGISLLIVVLVHTVVQSYGRGASSHLANLGDIKLIAREPRQFDLGAQKTFTLIGRPSASDGIEVSIELQGFNGDGSHTQPDKVVINTFPGRQTGIVVGGMLVKFAPTLEQP